MTAYIISWQGMIPLDGIWYYVIAGSIGLVFWLPYGVDRYVSPHVQGFASTLIFPLTFVSIELVSLLTNPYLTWGSLAYTQYHFVPLKQLASLTGLSGIVFIVAWFGAVVNWAWEQDFEWKQTRQGLGLYAGLLVAVLIYGGARLVWDGSPTQTVRVAGLTMTDELIELWIDGYINPDKIDNYTQTILDDYVTRTRQVVTAGAEIVAWDEGAIIVSPSKESDAIKQGQRLAQEEQIYLLMPLFVKPVGEDSLTENKIALIDPGGEIVYEYVKTVIVPGDGQVAGGDPLPVTGIPAGRLGAVVCYDMDDPRVIRQAGRSDVGLLLVPSDDWAATDPMHSWMASYRAIENGFSMFRPAREAVSETYDSRGRVLAAVSHSAPDRVMIAHVPVESAWALYPAIGDLFAWLNVADLVAIIVIGVVRRCA
jgi:apolipoprotein N-acyltransferase